MIEQFAHINHINDLQEHIKDCAYIGSFTHKNNATVICYVYNDENSFANIWERECRGITFREDGTVAIRTLHKFHNLNERESYRYENLDFSRVVSIDNKLDGSMIATGTLDYKTVVAKSKKSFDSDVAIKAQEFIDGNSEYTRFCMDMALKNLTPTFEYTSSVNRIVVRYEKEELTLLQIRDNVTGEYLDIHELSNGYDITCVNNAFDKNTSIKDVIRSLENASDIEGVIVNFDSGDKVKIKTPWYLNLHHSVTFVRYRDIARLVCEQTIDDFRALVVTGNYDVIDMDIINEIEHEIIDWIETTKENAKRFASEMISLYTFDNGEIDYKSISKKVSQEHDPMMFKFILGEVRGNNIKYMEFYKQHILKSRWGLDQIASSLISDRSLITDSDDN